jgi:hypothetical protein
MSNIPHRGLPDQAVDRNFQALRTQQDAVAAGGGAFSAPTLAGAWVNTGGASTTAGYIKDPMGFVHLRGTVKSGAGAIFTLPTGYRPSATVEYAVPGDGAYAQVSITSAGVVTQVVGAAVLGLSLDSISFKAA